MYIGFLEEQGKVVRDNEAFSYALSRSFAREEDKQEFAKEFQDYFKDGITVDRLNEFQTDLVDWFYSGNWIHSEVGR